MVSEEINDFTQHIRETKEVMNNLFNYLNKQKTEAGFEDEQILYALVAYLTESLGLTISQGKDSDLRKEYRKGLLPKIDNFIVGELNLTEVLGVGDLVYILLLIVKTQVEGIVKKGVDIELH